MNTSSSDGRHPPHAFGLDARLTEHGGQPLGPDRASPAPAWTCTRSPNIWTSTTPGTAGERLRHPRPLAGDHFHDIASEACAKRSR